MRADESTTVTGKESLAINMHCDQMSQLIESMGQTNLALVKRLLCVVDALREAVDCYGKPGGPWNVPGDPGGWLSRAREALGDE